MYIGPVLTDFIAHMTRVESECEIKSLVAEMGVILKLPHFALVSHVDLLAAHRETVAISNYNDEWVDRILRKRYYLDDPIHAACSRKRLGIVWHEAPDLIALSQRQRDILGEAEQFGLRDGVTVPVQSAGEYRGTCSFGGSRRVIPTMQLIAAVQLIGMFAFDAARRIIGDRHGFSRLPVPTLARRHIECIAMVASGLGDKESSARLGIAPNTVHKYTQEAMRRYGVMRRGALVFRALLDCQINFHHTA